MFIVIIKCLRGKKRRCEQKDENGRIWAEAGQLRVIAQNAIIALDTRINHRPRHFPTGLHLNSRSQEAGKLSENTSLGFSILHQASLFTLTHKLWRYCCEDVYNFKVNFLPSNFISSKKFFMTRHQIYELTKVLIRVDCRFFFTEPEKICKRRHNFD